MGRADFFVSDICSTSFPLLGVLERVDTGCFVNGSRPSPSEFCVAAAWGDRCVGMKFCASIGDHGSAPSADPS